jgi:hypothetical protein
MGVLESPEPSGYATDLNVARLSMFKFKPKFILNRSDPVRLRQTCQSASLTYASRVRFTQFYLISLSHRMKKNRTHFS